MKKQNSILLNSFIALLLGFMPAKLAAQTQWSAGGGSDLNWGQTANWSSGATPTAASFLYFEDLLYPLAGTNAAGLVNNIVETGYAAGGVAFTSLSGPTGPVSHHFTTLIPGGVTLTLGGLGAANPALAVGDWPGSGAWLSAGTFTNYSTITGAGSLVVNDSASLVSVGMRNRATLSLTGLDTFTASLKQLWIAASADNPNTTAPTGFLLLGKTNNVTTAANLTAPGVLLGNCTNASGTAVMELGKVNNFNTDGLVVGGRRSTSTFLRFGAANMYGATPGNFTLRGSAGGATPASVFSIGDVEGNWNGYGASFPGTASAATGTADFSGGTVDILADSIYIGRASAGVVVPQTGTGAGTLIVEQGTITATNLYLGYKPLSTDNTGGQGTLTLRSNAVMNVMKNVAFVFRTNGTAFLSESQINVRDNAVLNIGGSLTTTNIGSWTPPTVNLSNGVINMTGGGLVNIPTLNGIGYLTNAGNILVTNLVPGSATTAGTMTLGSNLTVISPGSLTFNLGSSTTIGSGVNDYVSVANNVTFNSNALTLTFGGPLAVGTYHLLDFGGVQTGFLGSYTNPTRSGLSLVQSAGHVDISVSSLYFTNIVWKATGASAAWDTTSLFWQNNVEKFYQLDGVQFDDTATATTVTVGGSVFPFSMLITNTTKAYTINVSSPGKISGATSLTKRGSGLLTWGGSSPPNDFTGPINIVEGMFRVNTASSSAAWLGNNANVITISSGATLEVPATLGSAGTYGWPIVVSGDGMSSTGAVISIQTSGPSLVTPSLTMVGNTSMASHNTGSLIIAGFGTAPYGGVFDLGGYTLTTIGANNGIFRISGMIMTNSGTINVSNAVFSVQNVSMGGTGPINLGSKVITFNSWTTGYLAKPININGGALSATTVSAPTILVGSAISLGGALNITNAQPIRLTNVLSGVGLLNKYGNSNLVMEAANTYSGATTIGGGRVVLTNGGSLASTLIQVDAALDVSAYGAGYNLANGQTLSLGSAGGVFGNLNVPTGSTLAGFGTNLSSVAVGPGGSVTPGSALVQGTLTVMTNLTYTGGTTTIKLGASTNAGAGLNDLVVVGGNLNFSAPTVIRIVPVATLNTEPYTLFQYSGTLSGIGNVTVTSDSRYSYTLDTSVPGYVRLAISGAAGNLTWKGWVPANPNAWNLVTTTNWLNGAVPDYFYQGDSVTFDDTANTNLVTFAVQVKPASITNNATGTYVLNGAGSLLAGSLFANSGTLVFANTNNNQFNGGGIVFNGGSVTFNQRTNVALTAKLSGYAGTMNKDGTNILTVTSADATNLVIAVNVNAGTLRAGSINVLGTGTTTVANGAALDVNGQILAGATTVHVAGSGPDGQGGINNRGAVQLNAISTLVLDDHSGLGAASNRWDISGPVTGNNYTLTKFGAADLWVHTGSDVGVSDIDVRAGRLIFGDAGTTLGDPSSPLTVRTNATLGFAGGIQAGIKQATVHAGGSLYATNSGNRFDGPMLMTNGTVIFSSAAGLTLGGNLSGPARLNPQGIAAGTGGTITLEGTNTYTGGTLVNDVTLVVANSNSLPANTNVILSSRVAYNTSSHPGVSLAFGVATPPSVQLDMQTVGSAGAAQASLGADGGTWSGPIKLTGNSANCRANFTANGTGGLTVVQAVDGTGFTGGGTVQISGSGCDTVTLEGMGVRFNSSLVFTGSLQQSFFGGSAGSPLMPKLYLGASGNYWPSTLFYRGIIQLGADNALPQTPMTVGQAFDGDHRFILDLNGHTQTIVNMIHTLLPGNDPIWIGNSSTNNNAMLTYAGVSNNVWAAFIVDTFDPAQPNPHTTALNVTAGTLRLMDQGYWTNSFANPQAPCGPLSNSYSGPTTVSGGTLRVDIGIPNSAVTVSGTGTLKGVGPFGSAVTVNSGGTLAPGNSIGTMTITSNLTLNAGGTCEFEVNLSSGTNDQVVGLFNVTYGGTLIVTNVGAQPFTNGTVLQLFTAASYTAGAVTIQPASPGNGLMWDASDLAVNGTLKVIPAVAPAIGGTAVLPSGNVSFNLNGVTGQGYSVRATTNVMLPIASWSVLISGSLPSATTVFTDLTATNYPMRFYRASTP